MNWEAGYSMFFVIYNYPTFWLLIMFVAIPFPIIVFGAVYSLMPCQWWILKSNTIVYDGHFIDEGLDQGIIRFERKQLHQQ